MYGHWSDNLSIYGKQKDPGDGFDIIVDFGLVDNEKVILLLLALHLKGIFFHWGRFVKFN